jgi:threonine dehydrogenase-like Zn-dependent dehydrogenase
MIGTAVWFVGPERLELRDEDVVSPGERQVQVRSTCALISTGSELRFYRGDGIADSLAQVGEGTLPFPVKFGYQQVGIIQATGTGTSLQVGDRVFCRYPKQDVFNIDEGHTIRIPDTVSDEQAAFAALFRVALNACITTPPLIGDCVAVSGLGVVGVFAGYLSRLTASRLILIEPNEHRRRQSGTVGADAVVSPDQAVTAVHELTEGRGVDLFIEASGAAPALQTALECTGHEGCITVASWYGSEPVALRLSPEYHLKRHKLISAGPVMPAPLAPRWNHERATRVAFEHLSTTDVESFVGFDRLPFERAAEAYARLSQPNSECRAMILTYSG